MKQNVVNTTRTASGECFEYKIFENKFVLSVNAIAPAIPKQHLSKDAVNVPRKIGSLKYSLTILFFSLFYELLQLIISSGTHIC
jgi:hypothetical protein